MLYGPTLALTVVRPEPDLVGIHTELRQPGVTLELLTSLDRRRKWSVLAVH